MITVQPDWTLAPDDAVAWAVDSNGSAYWYIASLPTADPKGFWVHKEGMEADNDACPLWRESLQTRPEE